MATVEARCGIDLHARGDAKLGNLLEHSGFESLTQLLKAYRGEQNAFRVPAMYLTWAHLGVLQVLGLRRINNLRTFNGMIGSHTDPGAPRAPAVLRELCSR